MASTGGEIWIKRSGVLCKVEESKATGRTRRIFVIESVAKIEEQFKKRKLISNDINNHIVNDFNLLMCI